MVQYYNIGSGVEILAFPLADCVDFGKLSCLCLRSLILGIRDNNSTGIVARRR